MNLKNIFIETNFLDVFFPKKSLLYQDFLFADEELNGTGIVDLLLKEKTENDFKNFAEFSNITTLVKKLETIPNVNTVQSYLEPVSMIHQELSQNQRKFAKEWSRIRTRIIIFRIF